MARTRAADFEEKQRGLLDKAAEVFADLGMEKASMAQIAAHSQVSKALLYHYYPSKDALIFAIIITHLEELDAAIEDADDPGLPPQQRLRRLVGTLLDRYRGADNQHKVQLNATPALADDQKAEILGVERRIVKRFAAVLREINPALDDPQRPLLTPVTMSLFGMMNWVYMWFRDGGRITREDYADVATTLILEGIKAVR
ncbi:TetR/AcrR family transcriptional regulator [Paracoccus sp. PS-1]|uniref:TetR/AcrR family transcriptional regulator n=1 Tax=unclassified Paracoccus (in: a-proteobacteria) TaxID=2688777 RepID=UPI00049192B0|nr:MULTISPECIES: TetR/AcrR family transcriptional regulator [unclassified Paracoccus (in: a-proteobacteria)]MDQ7263780.1 TetR/AcrR family transcriptional regulator [Paracoccus sp. PS1]RQP05775.1 MAG: TetR/AcrR family transcriptional regulator [Paracoccus sp. BP8]UFM66940.1 TetR/AcrR family transcriptional regulator [Paracoccus sp. MA]